MTKNAVEEAVRNGHYEVLPLLLSLDLRQNEGQLAEGLVNRGNEIEWGVDDMMNAVRNGRVDVAQWLCANTRDWNTCFRLNRVVKQALKQGDIPLVEWLLERGCRYYIPLDAAESGHPHVVRCMFEHEDLPNVPRSVAMKTMAAKGI